MSAADTNVTALPGSGLLVPQALGPTFTKSLRSSWTEGEPGNPAPDKAVIRWVPTPDQLSSPAILLDLGGDAVANILLFVPFGLLYALRGLEGKPLSPRHLLLMAFALSFSIEYYQVYCHNRSTSLLDLLDNVLGAYLGMKVGEVYVRKSTSAVAEPAA